MKIETASAASFTATQWITGAANFTDAGDPNAVAPSASRIVTIPPNVLVFNEAANAIQRNGLLMSCFLADGTSASLRGWWKDDVQNLWTPLGFAATAVTYATTNAFHMQIRHMPGVKLFVQVTANTGVTKIAVVIR
jgi:hypothetical protein